MEWESLIPIKKFNKPNWANVQFQIECTPVPVDTPKTIPPITDVPDTSTSNVSDLNPIDPPFTPQTTGHFNAETLVNTTSSAATTYRRQQSVKFTDPPVTSPTRSLLHPTDEVPPPLSSSGIIDLPIGSTMDPISILDMDELVYRAKAAVAATSDSPDPSSTGLLSSPLPNSKSHDSRVSIDIPNMSPIKGTDSGAFSPQSLHLLPRMTNPENSQGALSVSTSLSVEDLTNILKDALHPRKETTVFRTEKNLVTQIQQLKLSKRNPEAALTFLTHVASILKQHLAVHPNTNLDECIKHYYNLTWFKDECVKIPTGSNNPSWNLTWDAFRKHIISFSYPKDVRLLRMRYTSYKFDVTTTKPSTAATELIHLSHLLEVTAQDQDLKQRLLESAATHEKWVDAVYSHHFKVTTATGTSCSCDWDDPHLSFDDFGRQCDHIPVPTDASDHSPLRSEILALRQEVRQLKRQPNG
ncbi:hypothetical protein HDV05_008525, partial [Chytridiales sp. JEL 0842]